MKRRSFIRLLGGGVVMAAGAGGLAGCSGASVPASAIAAWTRPAPDMDLRRWVLSHAILAPNPHNLQPWIADIRTPGEITLSLDKQRLLPATDPYGRQILMGAGAFLELLTMAAAERGHRTDVSLFPAGEPSVVLDSRPFARVRLIADASVARDPLFAQVFNRRTDRRPYDGSRPITSEHLAQLSASISGLSMTFGLSGYAGGPSSDRTQVEAIRAITKEAWKTELTTEAPMMESMRVLRIGSEEIDRHRDGITITSPMLVTLAKLGLVDRKKFPAPDSQNTRAQIKDFNAAADSTPAYLWLITEGNSRAQQILAGRAYARVNLAGAARGLAMHPNEQALQEYPEVSGAYRAIHDLLGAPAPRYTLQMLARVGYLPEGAAPSAPAPRRGLDRHLVT